MYRSYNVSKVTSLHQRTALVCASRDTTLRGNFTDETTSLHTNDRRARSPLPGSPSYIYSQATHVSQHFTMYIFCLIHRLHPQDGPLPQSPLDDILCSHHSRAHTISRLYASIPSRCPCKHSWWPSVQGRKGGSPLERQSAFSAKKVLLNV